ncbi:MULTISPECIES: hypothetical protein [Sporosarcina]|nr:MULTISPECIES: hypothetical protein [Sporosarcina]
MNKRQAILLIIIILAIAVYCWILFFELPNKTVENATTYIGSFNSYIV